MKCSFCRKPPREVAKLIASPRRDLRRSYICDACVEPLQCLSPSLAQDIIDRK